MGNVIKGLVQKQTVEKGGYINSHWERFIVVVICLFTYNVQNITFY